MWGNKALRDKLGVNLPVETIDGVLTAGEKAALIDRIGEISGTGGDADDEDELSDEDTAKK